MKFESKINYVLNRNPKLKKNIKRIYQRAMCMISKNPRSEGNIVRVSPGDDKEYFFGYYDKSPWDITGRYMICMRANNTWSDVSPKEKADIILIDTSLSENDNKKVRKIAETRSWNVQQGCMMQWLGPDFDKEIIFNDFRNGKYISVILNVRTGDEKVIDFPIYSVSNNGEFALSLDFSRLYNLRPGYGYYNVPESTKDVPLPDKPCIWHIDLKTGKFMPLLKYTDFASFEPRSEMLEKNSVHKVNHIMISPDGKRFMVIYRWFNDSRKFSRLITCNTDGTDMFLLSDDDMVSHCFWKNNSEIIAFENKKGEGAGYYLMKDKTQEYIHLWKNLSNDGHPSYSPNGEFVVTDTYPDRTRIAEIRILSDKDINADSMKVPARVFAPFKYDNDTRCDLHPRWSRDGEQVCFDSVFEEKRCLYTVKVDKQVSSKIKILFLMTSCKKTGPTQQMLNIITNLDRKKFEPLLLTIYQEETDGTSQLYKFKKICKHIFVPVSKKDILLNKFDKLSAVLKEIDPDVIHSLGVFPDYAVSKIKKYPQIITLRNYVWDDYPAKFGKIKGTILAELHIYAMKHTNVTVTCSESLSKIYKEKLSMNYRFIRNGVDLNNYTRASENEKNILREKLDLLKNGFIFVYSGQIIERKNQKFLLEVFSKTFKDIDNVVLLLLGDGADYPELSSKYENVQNIIFKGNVTNVDEYLKASDVYVSTSKSEGMPNGVLEAMAAGLPVILSDIEQHKEIFNVDDRIGYLYAQNNENALSEKMKNIIHDNISETAEFSYMSAHQNFDAALNCRQYEKIYMNLSKKSY